MTSKRILIHLIPEGPYCYDRNGVCPFWSLNKNQPSQMNGYCSYLGYGDWEEKSDGLLWDQIKNCGVDENHEEYYGN